MNKRNEVVGYEGVNFQQNQDSGVPEIRRPIDPTIVGGFENSFSTKILPSRSTAPTKQGNPQKDSDDFGPTTPTKALCHAKC